MWSLYIASKGKVCGGLFGIIFPVHQSTAIKISAILKFTVVYCSVLQDDKLKVMHYYPNMHCTAKLSALLK